APGGPRGAHRPAPPRPRPQSVLTSAPRAPPRPLQPFAHPPAQVGASQLLLHRRALLRRDRQAHHTTPALCAGRHPPAPLRGTYPICTQFTSAYLAAPCWHVLPTVLDHRVDEGACGR